MCKLNQILWYKPKRNVVTLSGALRTMYLAWHIGLDVGGGWNIR